MSHVGPFGKTKGGKRSSLQWVVLAVLALSWTGCRSSDSGAPGQRSTLYKPARDSYYMESGYHYHRHYYSSPPERPSSPPSRNSGYSTGTAIQVNPGVRLPR